MACKAGGSLDRAHRLGVVARARDCPAARFRLAQAGPERTGWPPRSRRTRWCSARTGNTWCRAAMTRPSTSGSSSTASRGSPAPSDRRSTGSEERFDALAISPVADPKDGHHLLAVAGYGAIGNGGDILVYRLLGPDDPGTGDLAFVLRQDPRPLGGGCLIGVPGGGWRRTAARGWTGPGTLRSPGDGLGPVLLARRALSRVVRRRQDHPHLGRPGQGPPPAPAVPGSRMMVRFVSSPDTAGRCCAWPSSTTTCWPAPAGSVMARSGSGPGRTPTVRS